MTTTRRAKKATSNTGGRTGVIIEKAENENVNDWFDTAHSPEAQSNHNRSYSSLKEPSVDDGRNRATTKTTRKKTVKTPKRRVSMTLPGALEGGDLVSTKATNYAKKLRKGGTGINFTSPSDLSRVSTAPYSPRDEGRKESMEETKTDNESKSNQEDGSEIENALLTQEEEGSEEVGITEENEVIDRQSAAKQNTENLEPASPEDEFPAGGGQDEDEGNDLGPPVLPDDYSVDEQEETEQLSETKKMNDNDSDDEKNGSVDASEAKKRNDNDSDDEKNGSVDASEAKKRNDNDSDDEKNGSVDASEAKKRNDNDSDDEKNGSVDVSTNDYDNDDDGAGFNMVHDPETPEIVRKDRAKKEKLRNEKERKKTKKKSESDSEDDDEEAKSTPKIKKGRKQKKRKKRAVVFSPQGIPIANRDYESVPISALIESSPDEDGSRRSKRLKVKPLEYWRGEKMEFGEHNEEGYIGEAFGNMPVVTGIQKALPTPYRKRKQTKINTGTRKNGRKKISSGVKGNDEEDEYDSNRLRKKYKFHDGEEAYLWDDVTDDTADQKVVAYSSKMEGSDLPISKKRRKSEGKVTGKAAQAFNILSDDKDDYVGYIMGNLILQPKGIKDSESVGPCAQTFTVCHCQPKALEVAYGDPDEPDGELDIATAQRFLLGPGDMFRVPPGNCYRLENHSENTDCLLTWTIIRPRSVHS